MKKISKALLSIVLALSLVGFAKVTNADPVANVSSQETQIQSFNASELDQHPEIIKILQENDLDSYIIKEDDSNESIINRFDVQKTVGLSNEVQAEVGKEDAERIMKSYGLSAPTNNIQAYEQQIIVKESNDISVKSSNVWLLTYLTSNAGYTVSVVNVGTDPLDSVTGVLRKFNLKNRVFTQASSITFTKNSQGSGIVYNWAQPRDAVSDFLQYKITVKEDSSVFKYNNLNETLNTHKFQRYLFQTGNYNVLTALGGERHHFVSRSALTANGYNAEIAPAIRMTQLDHYQTGSRGGGTSASAFRANETALLKAKKYQELLQYEVDDFKASKDPDNHYSTLADKYLDQIVASLARYERYFGFTSS